MKPIPLLLALCVCCGCSQQGRLIGTPAAELSQPTDIQVVFNHRRGGRYRSPLTGTWRDGDDLEQFLIDAIDAYDRISERKADPAAVDAATKPVLRIAR